jgi:cytochrome c5
MEGREEVRPRIVILIAIAYSAFACCLLAQTGKTAATPAVKPPAAAAAHAAKSENTHDGEKVFAENCERCHNAPQGFSPAISGTVLLHMRARANLSKADVQALLRFLNP